jgi:hypothetical protein
MCHNICYQFEFMVCLCNFENKIIEDHPLQKHDVFYHLKFNVFVFRFESKIIKDLLLRIITTNLLCSFGSKIVEYLPLRATMYITILVHGLFVQL